MVFSGAQTIVEENVEDYEMIWDSVSTIVLAKIKIIIEKIKKYKVTMCSNGGN